MYINTLYLPVVTLFLSLGKEQGVQAWPYHPPSNPAQDFADTHFDYIIVGGGTAGLVVANRLSKNCKITVGVLEAGENGLDDPIIYTPGKVGWAVGTKYDWGFVTKPQPELGNRIISWARGKALGGSSAINFYVWMRGNKQDYDAWANLGNVGWDFTSMIPYFKKPEHFHVPNLENATNFKLDYNTSDHGIDGPIDTSYAKQYGGSHPYWHDTLNNLGLPRRDIFGGSNWGVWTGLTSVNPVNVTRSYSASAYYRPFAFRKNLKVLCNATVREVKIQTWGHKKVATGVRFTYNGTDYYAGASEEVIVSAGSVQSPQILELSGIGNPTYLNAAGIDVKVNNVNVGEHLQDRIMVVQVYEILNNVSNQDPLKDPVVLAAAEQQYAVNHTGLLTVLPTDFAYVPLKFFLTPQNVTDLRSLVTGTDLRTQNILSKLNSSIDLGSMEFVFDPNQLFPVVTPEPGKKYATMFQMLQYPFSTGNIHIPPRPSPNTKTTSAQAPIIDPKYYEGDGVVDLHTMAAGQVFADKIAREGPLNGIIVKRLAPPEPAPGEKTDWLQYVKDTTLSDWHPVGTCAMGGGPNGINKGVVDYKLKVYGVENLRVVDASIIPIQISSHLQGTVYAIAEKGAAMILEEYHYKRRKVKN
ncbi:hypothetical protein ABW20_dc0100387 [Dactylellina cionopaga]|nr:hypothetical protein ABW20_dc0100387 [Dactylellina cionopaga]